jgi:hypothetical protein
MDGVVQWGAKRRRGANASNGEGGYRGTPALQEFRRAQSALPLALELCGKLASLMLGCRSQLDEDIMPNEMSSSEERRRETHEEFAYGGPPIAQHTCLTMRPAV